MGAGFLCRNVKYATVSNVARHFWLSGVATPNLFIM